MSLSRAGRSAAVISTQVGNLSVRALTSSTMSGEDMIKSCKDYTLWSWSAQKVDWTRLNDPFPHACAQLPPLFTVSCSSISLLLSEVSTN